MILGFKLIKINVKSLYIVSKYGYKLWEVKEINLSFSIFIKIFIVNKIG